VIGTIAHLGLEKECPRCDRIKGSSIFPRHFDDAIVLIFSAIIGVVRINNS